MVFLFNTITHGRFLELKVFLQMFICPDESLLRGRDIRADDREDEIY